MRTILFVVLMLMAGFASSARFEVARDGEVGAYFVGAIAGYENLMTANFSDSDIDSPYISNRGPTGQYFSFGNHGAGSQVVLIDKVVDTNDWFYSIDAFNNDGIKHVAYSSFTLFDNTPYEISGLMVGFEDLYGGGDLDFNDHVVFFTNITAVPEPETYLMFMLGLGFLSARCVVGRKLSAIRNYVRIS